MTSVRILLYLVMTTTLSCLMHDAGFGLEPLVFDPNKPVHIDARHGITCEEEKKKCSVTNGVRVNQGDLFLNAESLTAYFLESGQASGLKQIRAQGHVVLKTQGSQSKEITADEVIADLVEKTLTLKGSTVEIRDEDLHLQCHEWVHYAQEKQRLEARGNVVLIRDHYILKGDRIVGYFTPNHQGQQRLSKVEVPTRCIISTPREYIEADRGVYDMVHQSLLLEGNVRITRESGQLRGDSVEVDLISGTSTVKSKKKRVELWVIPSREKVQQR